MGTFLKSLDSPLEPQNHSPLERQPKSIAKQKAATGQQVPQGPQHRRHLLGHRANPSLQQLPEIGLGLGL